MCTNTHRHARAHTHAHTRMPWVNLTPHTHTHARPYANTHIQPPYTHTHVRVRVCVCAHIHDHTHALASARAHTHTRTHTRIILLHVRKPFQLGLGETQINLVECCLLTNHQKQNKRRSSPHVTIFFHTCYTCICSYEMCHIFLYAELLGVHTNPCDS